MNGSKAFQSFRMVALSASLFAAMLAASPLPAHSQQEVDPTWYNPWTEINTAVIHPFTTQVSGHRHQGTVRPASTLLFPRRTEAAHKPAKTGPNATHTSAALSSTHCPNQERALR
jgi:hypothetical protein